MEILILSKYWYWYTLLAVGGLAAGIYSYVNSYPPLNKAWRILLAAFRAIAVILIGFLLIEPIINSQNERTARSRLAVIIDNSSSMNIKSGEINRIELADSLMSQMLSRIDYPYDVFTFSDGKSESGELPGPEEISGDATSISVALKNVESSKNSHEYGAVLLVTDGAHNLGTDPVDEAAGMDIPVYTFTVGEEVESKNISVTDVAFPPVAYSGDQFKIEVEVSAKGVGNTRSRLLIKQGGKTVRNTMFDIPSEGRSVTVEFEIEAQDPGNIEYEISTPVLDNETESADNKRLIVVRVMKSKVNVFLGTLSLNWEFKFIKQALEQFDDFNIDAVYPESPGRFSSPGIPRGTDGLNQYDIIILANCSPADIRISTGDLRQFLADGKSMIYVAGSEYKSNIRRFDGLLPFEIKNLDLSEGEFFFEPAPGYRQHAAITVGEDPDENKRLWNSLPPIEAVVTGLTPSGEVFLEARSSGGSIGSYPMLIAGRYEKGRVISIIGFPLWQSYFASSNLDGLENVMPRFWKNLVRWATSTEVDERFKVHTDKDVYRLGEPVDFTAYLNDESNAPKNGALVSVSIFPENEDLKIKDAVLAQVDNGIYTGEMDSPGSGNYRFEAVALSYGDTLGKYEEKFTVESFSLEMASSAPDYALTKRIAEVSGAVSYNADNIADFPDNLLLTPYTELELSQFKLFGMPLILGIIIVLLCVEWGLRKRFRLP